MTFKSILYNQADGTLRNESPELNVSSLFTDLNLDQIISAITSGKEEYNLKPFFYRGPVDLETIGYRQQVMKDLENDILLKYIELFAESMRKMREQLALIEKLHYKYQKERLFIDVVEDYCETVKVLELNLSLVGLKSIGLLNFREYLKNQVKSDHFLFLLEETKRIIADLSSVRYCIYIKGLRVQVLEYKGETDYSVEVDETFAKFKEGKVSDYRSVLTHTSILNEVETQILDGVAELYPDYFIHLNKFCEDNRNYQNELITIFDREIQFYIAYLNYMDKFKQAGLKFCYPHVSNKNKEVYNYEGFDLALANNLVREKSGVVVNDFYLRDAERILIVSGPNQGGKTTFARTFGQIHYLAALGCPVPGSEAQLFHFDRLLTHFEKEENIKNLRGKLQDELFRIHLILEEATPGSVMIINEIFTSTTLQDQIFLSKKIMQKIIDLDLLCVWVTFIDELASFSETTVSMVSSVVPENTAMRTYKITRKPADGLAFALSIAEKYRLTYNQIRERIKL